MKFIYQDLLSFLVEKPSKELLSEKHKIIQVLTHPVWWQPNNSLPPLETVIKCCLERLDSSIDHYNKVFNEDSDRINKSALTDNLNRKAKIIDSDILNTYAKFPLLLNFLRANNVSDVKVELDKIANKFLTS